MALTAWVGMAAPGSSRRVIRNGTQHAGELSRWQTGEVFRGIGCYYSGEARLRVRASADGVLWSPWVETHEEFQLGDRAGTDLIYFDEERRYLEIEVVSGKAEGLQVLFIDPGAGAKPQPRQTTGSPAIVGRAQWGCTAQTCPVRGSPAYTQVTHLVVHHSAGTNNATDWAAVVRAIWILHVEGNGWNDIGYNYLIDPNGVVYEGRAGGDGVLGAHFSGVNSGTSGICLMGTFSTVSPREESLTALEQVLAWQAAKWGLDGGGQRVHAASQLRLNVVSGHRDAGLSPRATSRTECPGNGLYTALAGMRGGVRRRLEGSCPVKVSGAPRCLRREAGRGSITVTAPAGCGWEVEATGGWVRARRGEAGEVVLEWDANGGARRTAAVRIAGREFELTQAEAGVEELACVVENGVISAGGAELWPVAPHGLVSAYGTGLSGQAVAAVAFPLPLELGGVRVLINGRAVPLLFVSSGQINFQLPANTAIGTAMIAVEKSGVAGPETPFWISEAAPVLFRTGGRAIAVNHADGKLNGPEGPACPGSALTFYLSGGGAVSPAAPAAGVAAPLDVLHTLRSPVEVRIGNRTANVLFIGLAPGMAGVYQANIVVPDGVPGGDQEVQVSVAGASERPALTSICTN